MLNMEIGVLPGAYFIKLFTVDRVTADIGQYRDTLQWPVFHIVFAKDPAPVTQKDDIQMKFF